MPHSEFIKTPLRKFFLAPTFLCLLLYSFISVASPALNSITQKTQIPVSADYNFLEDATLEYDIDTVRTLPESAWQKPDTQPRSFGFSDSQYWLRFTLSNQVTDTRNYLIELAYPLLDDVTFFAVRQDGSTRTLETGDTKPFYPRDIDHPNPLFRVQMDADEEARIYLRVQTQGSMILPLRIWYEKEFFEYAAIEQKTHFFYYGALTVIVLINIAVFFTLRERLYLFYASAIMGYLLFFWTSRGYSLQLFLPNLPALNSQLFVLSMPILALFSLLFAREFLKTAQHSPKTDLCIRGMIYFEYFNMLAALLLDYNTAVKISAVSSFFFFAVLFIAGPVTWAAKRRAGIYFTIAWLPLTLGVAATGGRTSGVLPDNFWTEYAMQIGSGLEAIILTLALAERLYREREKKIRAQAQSLEVEKQRHEAQSQLTEAMMRDAITHLPNRNRFEWLLATTLNKPEDDRYIVGVARITRISEITRTLGLASSERVLRTIAARMNEHSSGVPGVVCLSGNSDTPEAAFQLSGDTFGVLIRESVSKNHIALYRDIMITLLEPIEVDSLVIELAPRFGCALYPKHGNTPAELIRNAHVAMESALHAPDQIGWYDEKLDIYNKSRLTLMSDLKEALIKDEPELHYQPKLDLNTGGVVGFEALIRWHHPERGNVPPFDFIPLAEETGVIHSLTKWAFVRAAKDSKKLESRGIQGNIAINISARDLLNTELVNNFRKVIEDLSIDPSTFFLELTETAAMEDPNAGLKALQQLSALGLKISIDDFGAGHSSLSYLKRLPATELKLDRSLVHDICHEENALLIVRTTIQMAHSLGYLVVAEGVEDQQTYALLKALGCDKLQGYWLARPMTLEEIPAWMQSWQERAKTLSDT